MQRRHRPSARTTEDTTNRSLDAYRSIFANQDIQDFRTWIRQGYVEDTEAASTLSDAIDQLPPFDWPDDAPETITLECPNHFIDVSREEQFVEIPRRINYRDDGGTHSTIDSDDTLYLSDFLNLRPSISLLKITPYREWYRTHIFAQWLAERPRLHSVQLTLTELVDIWQRYRHHEVHYFNPNILNSNEHNYTSSSNNSDSDPIPSCDYPYTTMTPPGTPRSGSSLQTGTPPMDYEATLQFSDMMMTMDMTPPPSPTESILAQGEDM
jgi:hypothetical protein